MKFLNIQNSALMVSVSALSFLMITGCVSNKSSIQPETKLEEGKYVGIVTNEFVQRGCSWIITYNDGSEDKYLIPVQLEEEYKNNGQKIEFSFHLSRINQGDCQLGKPAVLESIEVR
ncbi:hypothetical protein OAE93_00785 [bacterium]|nr:hypothetical protein [bacterium]